MKRILLVLMLAAVVFGSWAAVAQAERSEAWYRSAAFIDEAFLQPHNSPVTGEMVMEIYEWYGIPPIYTLTIMGAETSMGDPRLGGRLVGENNFGCIKYMGTSTRWGELSDGSVRIAGSTWYTWPSPAVGAYALGRFLKVGVNGKLLSAIARSDHHTLTGIYYGWRVSGLGQYRANWGSIYRMVQRKAAAAGWVW